MFSSSVFNTWERPRTHWEWSVHGIMQLLCHLICNYFSLQIAFGMWILTSGKGQRCEPRPSVLWESHRCKWNPNAPPGTLIIGSLLAPPPCSGRIHSHPSAATSPQMGMALHPSMATSINHSFQKPPWQSCLSARRTVVPVYEAAKLQSPPGDKMPCLQPWPSPPSALASPRMRRNGQNTLPHSTVSHIVIWTLAQPRPRVSQKKVPIAST